jgi:hypothetical protein
MTSCGQVAVRFGYLANMPPTGSQTMKASHLLLFNLFPLFVTVLLDRPRRPFRSVEEHQLEVWSMSLSGFNRARFVDVGHPVVGMI